MDITLITLALVTLGGLVCKRYYDIMSDPSPPGGRPRYASRSDPHVAWSEFAVVLMTMTLVITPATQSAGSALSKDMILRHEQWINGKETHAGVGSTRTCRGGRAGLDEYAGRTNCHWKYKSGSYSYIDTCTRSKLVHYTDADGKDATRWEEEEYTCTKRANIWTPFSATESTYYIDASARFKKLKRFEFDEIYVSPTPYNPRMAIPKEIPRGPPADWIDADRHLKAGDPRSVTALDWYDDYIIAANDEALKENSPLVGRYRKLIPDHTTGIKDDPLKGPTRMQADKVSFVGVKVAHPAEWQSSLMRYNGSCGPKLECDAHLVMVDCAKVDRYNADDYASAVKTHWQSPYYGKRTIAKNTVIIVLGVCDNSRIDWARVKTGMPFGNETMEEYLKNFLPGTLLEPRALFGAPRAIITGKIVKVEHPKPTGVIEDIMFTKVVFKRARMECNDGSCVGFKHLIKQVEPTKKQKAGIIAVAVAFALGLWILVAKTSFVERTIDRLIDGYYRLTRNNRTTDPPVINDDPKDPPEHHRDVHTPDDTDGTRERYHP